MPPPVPSSSSRHSLALALLLLLSSLLPPPVAPNDRSQADCQANELFLECGSCEGTCKSPVINNCRKECKPPRCECQAKTGFVRAHDGACIPLYECANYRGAYFGQNQVVTQNGVSLEAPKTVLTHFRPVGSGFAPLDGSNGPADSQLAPLPAQPRREASPPSIKPPGAFTVSGPVEPGQQAVAQDQPVSGPQPPQRHRDQSQGGHQRQSHMNLFADLAEGTGSQSAPLAGGGLGPVGEPLGERDHRGWTLTSAAGGGPVAPLRFRSHPPPQPEEQHRGQHQEGPLTGQQSARGEEDLPQNPQQQGTAAGGEEQLHHDPSEAKCGGRKCREVGPAAGKGANWNTGKNDRWTTDKRDQWQNGRGKSRSHHPYLYALVNPPSLSAEQPIGGSGREKFHDPPQQLLLDPMEFREQRAIPPLAPNLRIYRQRRVR